jgi:hypothetical protein
MIVRIINSTFLDMLAVKRTAQSYFTYKAQLEGKTTLQRRFVLDHSMQKESFLR